jgi:hypothetical protein
VPNAQSVHVVPPNDADPYCPARQLVQTAAPAAEYLPLAHAAQSSELPEPESPYAFPAAQAVHASVPVVILYLPAAHNTHVPDSPVYVEPQLTAAADTRPIHATHAITNKTRTSRMPHTPRAFIYLTRKMGFVLSIFIKSNVRRGSTAPRIRMQDFDISL